MKTKPPKWANGLLKWISSEQKLEILQGDIYELFQVNIERYGSAKAKLLFVQDVLYMIPFTLKRKRSKFKINSITMLKHYLLTTIRGLKKNKLFSAINISGLVLGITACLLILQYTNHELSYDDFHVKKDVIYRLKVDQYRNNELHAEWAGASITSGPSLQEYFPEIIDYVRLTKSNTALSYKNNIYREDRVYYASESFFKMFSYNLIKGIDSVVLKEPFTMAISQSTAKKYFREEDPMGKVMVLNGWGNFKVSGVFEDPPENTHLKADILYSFETYEQLVDQTQLGWWDWMGFWTYFELEKSTVKESFEMKLASFIEQERGDELRENEEWEVFHLQPLTDIHLNSNVKAELEVNGDRSIINGLLTMAIFIIIVAWLNYINLSTARSLNRAKEIGVRKVMGSNRKQLIQQFLFESFFLNTVAAIVSLIFLFILTPYFDFFTGKPLATNIFSNFWFLMLFPLSLIAGSILSGLYPALVISGFRPITALKGSNSLSKGQVARKVIVVFQFIVSMVLMVGTITVYQQINFMQKKELGVNLERTLVLKGPTAIDSTYFSKYRALKTELLSNTAITHVTTASDVPGPVISNNAGSVTREGAPSSSGVRFRLIDMDDDYVDTYGLEIIAGRNFSRDFSQSKFQGILNERAVTKLGFSSPVDAVGQKITLWGDNFEIIGVLKNYHQDSPKSDFEQILYRPLWDERAWQTYYSVKFNTVDTPAIIDKISETYSSFFPGNPVDYFFADDLYNQQYESDQLFNKLFNMFAGLAIFISCLGLIGLSTYTLVKRMKEVGIRKVLGASMNQIAWLMTSDFTKLVGIAIIVGLPIAWYIMDGWLDDYAFRIQMSWMHFIIPAAALLVIAILTIYSQVHKAATQNPVESLKDE